jgi:hypothetical protein
MQAEYLGTFLTLVFSIPFFQTIQEWVEQKLRKKR